MNNQEPSTHPGVAPPPPPPSQLNPSRQSSTSSNHGPPSLQPRLEVPQQQQYVSNNHNIKYSSYNKPPPSYQASAPAPAHVESRYPPTSTSRHRERDGCDNDDDQRITAPITPIHPADKFGKTITVSDRTSINDTPPKDCGTLQQHKFSPSKSGAFLPYYRSHHNNNVVNRPTLSFGTSSNGQPPRLLIQPKLGRSISSGGEEASDDEIKAVNSLVLIEESRDDDLNDSQYSEDREGPTAFGGEEEDERVSMKISESGSKESIHDDTNNEKDLHQKPTTIVSTKQKQGAAKSKRRPQLVTTTHNLLPVNVNDDTPKHINMSTTSTKGGGGNKRTKLLTTTNSPLQTQPQAKSELAQPDLSELNTHSMTSLHDPQNGGSFEYYNRDPPPVLNTSYSRESLNGSHGGNNSITDGDGGGIQESWMTTLNPASSSELYGNVMGGQGSSTFDMSSLSWEVPNGLMLSTVDSTLSFNGLVNNQSSIMKSPLPNNKDEKMIEDVEDDFPPLPSQGSLPMKKRTLLAPRPRTNTSKSLFDPPRPNNNSDGLDDGGGRERTIEVSSDQFPQESRDDGNETKRGENELKRELKYAPTLVHYARRDDPPPLPSYHHPTTAAGYDPRRPLPYHTSPGRFHQPEFADSQGHQVQATPWGNPPSGHSGFNSNFPSSSQDHDMQESQSFDSNMSKRSFRSLDDLEMGDEPIMDSLLYRPSFSWERGLDVPPQQQSTATSSSQYHQHNQEGHQYNGGQYNVGAQRHCFDPPHLPPNPSLVGSSLTPMPPSQVHHHYTPLIPLYEQQKIMRSLTLRSEIRTIGNPTNPNLELILLLGMPNDMNCLSESLCIVRNNIEVFTATEMDLCAPAPGRKKPIRLGQVGLRCVYCRMLPSKERKKRSCAFPASMKRIYRSVIDMKLDHFKICPCVPPGLKTKLCELQEVSKRSTGVTVQYFNHAAKLMGMIDVKDDGVDGVGIDLKRVGLAGPFQETSSSTASKNTQKRRLPMYNNVRQVQPQAVLSNGTTQPAGQQMMVPNPHPPVKRYQGSVLLALEEDVNFLSPLRCFLRENVCLFTASSNDVAIRCQSTYSVRAGQVGLGCIHCLKIPQKQRSNRAVCFPFTVSRVYQSVADIQRFHFAECKMMPPELRAKFTTLQDNSDKGSKGLSTKKYWLDGCKKLGLADSCEGMYFSRDPALPPPTYHVDDENLDVLAQVACNNSSGKMLITIDDKPTIAGFIYLVMEQIRTCTFTDADRNKRRAKSLGQVGVECIHCAGKIEGRKFFWSSVSAAESNFVSVHSHMLKCKYVPQETKDEIVKLKETRKEETNRLRPGSQKAFFMRVWARLHGLQVPSIPNPSPTPKKRKHSKSPKKVHTPKGDKKDKKVADGAQKEEKKKKKKKKKTAEPPSVHQPPQLGEIHTANSQDSAEIRHILESKSTLSSMPSIDGCIDDIMDLVHSSSFKNTDQSSEFVDNNIQTAASKSSLTSVANNMSAVTMHCKEEEEEASKVNVAEV